jgi:hypothetical protein
MAGYPITLAMTIVSLTLPNFSPIFKKRFEDRQHWYSVREIACFFEVLTASGGCRKATISYSNGSLVDGLK